MIFQNVGTTNITCGSAVIAAGEIKDLKNIKLTSEDHQKLAAAITAGYLLASDADAQRVVGTDLLVAGTINLPANGKTAEEVGSGATTGLTIKEFGDSAMHKTVFTFTNFSIATVDATTNGATGSQKIYTFPEGLVSYIGGSSKLTIARVGTAIQATAAVVGGVGTVAAAADVTLTGTEQDLIPSTAATLTTGAGAMNGKSLTATAAVFDGTGTAKAAFLNFTMPDAGSTGNDALLVNGTITLVWSGLGDN